MGNAMQGLIHYNPHRKNQVDQAQAWLASGFAATPKRTGAADVHVVSGPWFAYETWRGHSRTLMVDRAYWGNPEYVSIGWLNPDGTRRFAKGTAPRPKPEYEAWRTREWSCLVLADYDQDVTDIAYEAGKRFGFVEVRKHPANEPNCVDLASAIRLRDVIVCGKGTAGFQAIMQGKPVICLDPKSEIMPVACPTMTGELYRGDRDEWLHDMSYKQWSLAEIASGTAWQHLKDV